MSQADRQRARRDKIETEARERLRRAQRLDQLGARIAHLAQLRDRTVQQLDLLLSEVAAEMVGSHSATVSEVVQHADAALDRKEIVRLRQKW